jgi:glycosyltransferase involved in cell wall biosynthesis
LMAEAPLRARLAQAGYEKIAAFTWPSLAERLESIFSSTLG